MIKVQNFEASVAAAAFIADIPERDVNRIIDEGILPKDLLGDPKTKGARRFPGLACVFASFYFHETYLTKEGKQRVITSFVDGFKKHDFQNYLWLKTPVKINDWEVVLNNLKVELGMYATQAQQRLEMVMRAESMVIEDREILNGEPVFKGTRVPVRTIAAWIEKGIDARMIQESYPSVTDDMLKLAPVFVRTNPRRGRPPKFGDLNPDWKLLKATRVVK
jgi:uncharacterized protein (DUF433 family)